MSASEIADLEEQVSEQGTVVSQVKEVRSHPCPVICPVHISNTRLEQCRWALAAVSGESAHPLPFL